MSRSHNSRRGSRRPSRRMLGGCRPRHVLVAKRFTDARAIREALDEHESRVEGNTDYRAAGPRQWRQYQATQKDEAGVVANEYSAVTGLHEDQAWMDAAQIKDWENQSKAGTDGASIVTVTVDALEDERFRMWEETLELEARLEAAEEERHWYRGTSDWLEEENELLQSLVEERNQDCDDLRCQLEEAQAETQTAVHQRTLALQATAGITRAWRQAVAEAKETTRTLEDAQAQLAAMKEQVEESRAFKRALRAFLGLDEASTDDITKALLENTLTIGLHGLVGEDVG